MDRFFILLTAFTLSQTAYSEDPSRGIFGSRFEEGELLPNLNGNVRIYGQVFHNGATNSISNATIIIEGLDTTITNDTGYFEFIVEPGMYDITVHADGYTSLTHDSLQTSANHGYKGWFSIYKNEGVYFKPVIYLYSQETLDVHLKFDNPVHFDFTYPEYNNGWAVSICDGKINHKGNSYDYLFWEGKTHSSASLEDMHNGSIVTRDNLTGFFEGHLSQLGLNPREIQDFIVFWVPKLSINDSTLIHFSTTKYEHVVPLSIKPKPQSKLRFFMVYMDAQHVNFPVRSQTFEPIKREGFTVIEWGGGPFNPDADF